MSEFLEAMMDMLPADKAAAIRASMVDMTPEQVTELEASAKQYYGAKRNARDRANIEKAVRYNHADRLPTGAAAQRRVKQMERNRAKSAG